MPFCDFVNDLDKKANEKADDIFERTKLDKEDPFEITLIDFVRDIAERAKKIGEQL